VNPLDIAIGALALTLLPAIWRIVRGPTAADRAVASDLVFFVFVAVVALLAVRLDVAGLFDVVIVATVVGFLAPVTLARLIDRGRER
jgi:multicomponent Na+:H+ antiporter subunit F